jgi:DNA repair protein RadC
MASESFSNIPKELKPREQMQSARTPRELSDEALLAILLKNGSEGCNVLELARGLIRVYGSLKSLMTADWRTMRSRVKEYNRNNPEKRILGLGQVKCMELAAAFELGRRKACMDVGEIYKKKVRSPQIAFNIFRAYIEPRDTQESFLVLPLDSDDKPLSEPILMSRGTADHTIVHPRDVFKDAVRWGASSIVVAHNHPSGDPAPSHEDIMITDKLKEAGRLVDIRLLDHLIIGDGRFVSMNTLGYLS